MERIDSMRRCANGFPLGARARGRQSREPEGTENDRNPGPRIESRRRRKAHKQGGPTRVLYTRKRKTLGERECARLCVCIWRQRRACICTLSRGALASLLIDNQLGSSLAAPRLDCSQYSSPAAAFLRHQCHTILISSSFLSP